MVTQFEGGVRDERRVRRDQTSNWDWFVEIIHLEFSDDRIPEDCMW